MLNIILIHSTEKLARINNLASAQTTRKAHITSRQLGRRYQLIYESLGSKNSLNLAKVTRWYSSQPDVSRRSLERAEPFTWLKHLDKLSGKSIRSPWHVTALITEFRLNHALNQSGPHGTLSHSRALNQPQVAYELAPPILSLCMGFLRSPVESTTVRKIRNFPHHKR